MHFSFLMTFWTSLIYILPHSGIAQKLIPDSLANSNPTQKIIFLNEQAQKQQTGESAELYYNKAMELASSNNYDSLKLVTQYKRTNFYYQQGLYKKVFEEVNTLDSLARFYNNLFYQFRSHTIRANSFKMTAEENKALSEYEKAVEITKTIGDSLYIADAYNNVGDAYMYLEEFEKSKKYFLLALNIYEQLKVPETEKYVTYKNLSRVSDNLEETEFYLDKAFQIVKNEKNPKKLALFYLTKGDALMTKEYYAESITAFQESYRLADSIDYAFVKTIAAGGWGIANTELGNYDEAILKLREALTYEQPSPKNKLNFMQNLAKAYEGKLDFKSAYAILKEGNVLNDSINVSEANAKYAEFDAKFKTELKDKEITKQQLEITRQKNVRNKLIFYSVVILLIALGLFQWRSNKQKRKKIAVEAALQKEQEINDLRTKFLGNIAHEIRTPLTLVTGNLNLALENLENPKKAKKNIDTALENSKRITADANEILELLRFENSSAQVKKETILLDETLKRIIFSFSSLVEMKQIALNYKSEIPKTLFAEIDIEKTEKIINNLLSNAIKYSPSNTEIIIKSKIENGKLIISVTDFGDGIHYDETEKIFERFYQSVRNTTVGGIGIGLSLSRELAEAMGGSLTVNSEWKKGSTFTFTVPISEAETLTVASRKVINPETISSFEATEKTKSSQHSKILIVEDNPEMVNYLEEILSPMHQCEVAFDGEEALQKINSTNFDLITSDIMMPKMDGFQLREALNQSEAFKNIPFILLSAKTLEEDKIKGFKLGIDDYIVKPFNKNELIARINNLLANKSARQTYQIKNPDLLSTSESSDQKLLKKVEEFILENIDNEEFKIQELAESVGYSQRQFTRILKQYTGMTPVKFILEIRLQKAYQHLQHKTFFTLSEVRYHVGISSSAYFNKKFKERFGINPSDLLS